MTCICRQNDDGWSSLEDCRPPCSNYEAMQASYAAQDMQPAVDALLNQEPFRIGETKTVRALQRDSNYLIGHGSYIADWSDATTADRFENASIFEQMMLLSDAQVRGMIAERIAGIDPAHLSNLNVPKEERDKFSCLDIRPQWWMRPGNKDFVLIQNDRYRYCYGIYAHDFKNYLIRGETKRIAACATGLSIPNERLNRALRGEF